MVKTSHDELESDTQLEESLRDLIHPCPSLLDCGICPGKHIKTLNELDPDFDKIPRIISRWLRQGMPMREVESEHPLAWYGDHYLPYWLSITCSACPLKAIPWVMSILADPTVSIRARDLLLFYGLRSVIGRFGHQSDVSDALTESLPLLYELFKIEDASFAESLIYTLAMIGPEDLQTRLEFLFERYRDQDKIAKALHLANVRDKGLV